MNNYVDIYTHLHTYLYEFIYIYIHLLKCSYISEYIYDMYMYIYIYIYADKHICITHIIFQSIYICMCIHIYIYINIEIQGIHWISLAMDLPSCIQMWAAECCLFRFHSLAMAHQLVWCFSHAMLVYIYIYTYKQLYIYIVWGFSCSEQNIIEYMCIYYGSSTSYLCVFNISNHLFFQVIYIYIDIYIIYATLHVSYGNHCVVSRMQWQWEAKHCAIVQK